MKSREAGFTLLEALVAMAIFSFIGVAAYNLLASTGRLKESGDEGYAALSGMQLAFRQIEDDLSQFASRPVAGRGQDQRAALESSPEDAVVEVTRAGWRNPLGLPRSGLQRVAWAIDEENRLVRRYRVSTDEDDPDAMRERVYVTGVDAFEMRYLDERGRWIDSWPPESSPGEPTGASPDGPAARKTAAEPVPRAVDVRIAHARFGELNRVIPLR